MSLYPVKLSYITKSMIWGGTKLLDPACGWNLRSEYEKIGEAWKLTCREKEMSFIENGEYKGVSLGSFIDREGQKVIGAGFKESTFPLLIKLIDACDKLSVQVHPDDDYAARVENGCGKTEMWVILEADPGAELIYGLNPGLSASDFEKAVREGRYDDVLCRKEVHKGDDFFIPSGMVHAIGKGILIAEIQQNCDLTYRVYDYDRRQPDGTLRQLHVEKALAVTRPFTQAEIDAIRFESVTKDERGDETVLAHCRYFKTRRYAVDKIRDASVSKDSFQNLLCLEGSGEIVCGGVSYPIAKGDDYYLPAGMGDYQIKGNLTILEAAIK